MSTYRENQLRQMESSTASDAGISPQEEKIEGEMHSSHGAVVKDVVMGFADGLTVPFAVTAGLSSIGSTDLVIIGGLAEIVGGAISMGLGAYLSTVSETEHYDAEKKREEKEVVEKPHEEAEEIYEILTAYGVSREAVAPFVEALKYNPDMWVKFMMDYELKLERPAHTRAYISLITMGAAYFIGGLIPMIPYFTHVHVDTALFISIGITVVILLVFGYLKCIVNGSSRPQALRGAVQTLCVGSAAAGASYGIVRGINAVKKVQLAG